MYPAFVNCTTIDWFTEWPKDALLEVAEKYLEEVTFEGESDAITEVQFNFSCSNLPNCQSCF